MVIIDIYGYHKHFSCGYNKTMVILPCPLLLTILNPHGIARPTLMWGGEYYRDIAGVARLWDNHGIVMGNHGISSDNSEDLWRFMVIIIGESWDVDDFR
jgi:hypothetical protein